MKDDNYGFIDGWHEITKDEFWDMTDGWHGPVKPQQPNKHEFWGVEGSHYI